MSHFYQNYHYSVPLKVVVFIYSVKMLSFEKHVVKTARSSNIMCIMFCCLVWTLLNTTVSDSAFLKE